jgi:hypothetical protein
VASGADFPPHFFGGLRLGLFTVNVPLFRANISAKTGPYGLKIKERAKNEEA